MSAVKEANEFLAPVFDKEQLISFNEVSLILRLSKPLTSSTDKSAASPLVINHALQLLLRIHQEVCVRDLEPAEKRLERPGERRTIFSLLDLLVLEGIYPSLSPGVGIPIQRRARSFVLPQHMTTPTRPTSTRVHEVGQDIELLGRIVDGLCGVLSSPTKQHSAALENTHAVWKSPRDYRGIEMMVRERVLVDLIAGCGELALNPGQEGSGETMWKQKFSNLLDDIQTGALLPLMMSLLHPASPPWFRAPIAKYLSQLPVSRPHGVRDIIKLFLSTASSGTMANAASAQLSIEALSKASKLISSVPTSLSAQAWFSKVCPQLLDILQSNDLGMERAAAYVIAELLGKNGAGMEDVVETEIVRKIIDRFDPRVVTRPPVVQRRPMKSEVEEKKSSQALLAFEGDLPAPASSKPSLIVEVVDEDTAMTEATNETEAPLVSETDLSMAFRNLEVLMASHPTPVLPQRLISPILIPLWGIMGYAKSIGRSVWHERAAALLKSFMAISMDLPVVEKIKNNLTFNGGDGWEYAPGSFGGIEIRSRTSATRGGVNMELIDSRIEEFMGILGNENVPNTVLSGFFLSIFRTWLARGGDEEPLKMLITVKLLQEMLQTHGQELAKKPTEILQIVKGILDEYFDHVEVLKQPSAVAGGAPRLASLGKIVQDAPTPVGDDGEGSPETQRTETVAMALTLLSVLISSPETKLDQIDERLVATLHPPLQYLSEAKDIDPNLKSLAVNITSLLLIHAPTKGEPSAPTPLVDQQREKYGTALSYLRDPLIPVRAHGLHLLRELILERASILDVTNTTRLLVTMLKDGDSFVYLNVVKCLAALTDRHSKTVTRMLVSAYINDEDVLDVKEHLGLDERLRIGEALLGTVQKLGRALVGETAEVVAQGMLSIVSRRRSNPKPAAPPQTEDEDDALDLGVDPETGARLTPAQLAQREHAAKIIYGWSSTPHEDLRIRASALSILGAAVQTNPSGVGRRVLDDTVDTALAILSQETTAEAGILRRAAVVAVSAVLNGLVRADEEDREGTAWRSDVWRVVAPRVADIARVLGYVGATDADGLVREQAAVVEESLAAVVARRVAGGEGAATTPGGGTGIRVL